MRFAKIFAPALRCSELTAWNVACNETTGLSKKLSSGFEAEGYAVDVPPTQ